MEEISNKPGEGVGANEGNPEGQAQPQVVPESNYKALESEYTKIRQSLIATNVKIAQSDPKAILDLANDVKLQNAVIKEMYGLNNLKELTSVHGEKFYDNGGDDPDEMEKIKRELNLLKFKSSVGETESAIKDFKASNAKLFEEKESEAKLRDSLEFLSASIPLQERIALAAKLAFGNVADPTKEAFKDLAKATTGASSSAPVETKKQ